MACAAVSTTRSSVLCSSTTTESVALTVSGSSTPATMTFVPSVSPPPAPVLDSESAWPLTPSTCMLSAASVRMFALGPNGE